MPEALLRADWPAPGNIVAGTTLRRGSDALLPAAPCWLTQVHGRDVVRLGPDDTAAGAPEADASISEHAGAICVVRTADCLPILLCSKDGHEIAAAHAGWRGLAAGVAENTVAAFSRPPGQLLAWLGPAISQSAFEVGDEVREAFLEAGADAAEAFTPNARGRWQADLYRLARQRLAAAGISRITGGGWCTYSDPERFYSFRRDGSTGRMVSFIHRSF